MILLITPLYELERGVLTEMVLNVEVLPGMMFNRDSPELDLNSSLTASKVSMSHLLLLLEAAQYLQKGAIFPYITLYSDLKVHGIMLFNSVRQCDMENIYSIKFICKGITNTVDSAHAQ